MADRTRRTPLRFRGRHVDLKVSQYELESRHLAFLPQDEEAYLGMSVAEQSPEKVKGHPVLILEIFDAGPGKERSNYVWALVVSAQ